MLNIETKELKISDGAFLFEYLTYYQVIHNFYPQFCGYFYLNIIKSYEYNFMKG